MANDAQVSFKTDELKETAKRIAKSQHYTDRDKPLVSIQEELEEAREILINAYREFAGAVKSNQEITPAAEWLIDNYYIIQEQFVQIRNDFPVSYQKSIPRLIKGPLKGYPRIYELIQNIVLYNDNVVEIPTLTEAVHAYQEETTLKIGEIWAIPILVRFILIKQLAEKAEIVLGRRRFRPKVTDLVNELIEIEDPEPGEIIGEITSWLSNLPQNEIEPFILAELVNQMQSAGILTGEEKRWFEYRFRKFGLQTEEALRLEAQTQSRHQVSIQNAVVSLRDVSITDWSDFVEECSLVEKMLQLDPAGVYPDMDFQTRDRYRGIIEGISRGTGLSETEVTEEVLVRADKANGVSGKNFSGLFYDYSILKSHVGYYLLGEGYTDFCRSLTYHFPLKEKIKKKLESHPRIYVFSVGLLTLFLLSLLWVVTGAISGNTFIMLAVIIISFFPAMDLAVSLANRFFAWFLPPRILPKMDYDEGVPDQARTLVVVPTMITSLENVRKQVEELEIKALANGDPSLQFALLTDFKDSKSRETQEDSEILDEAVKLIAELNQKYNSKYGDKYFLLHRKRLWNEKEQVWMGWERKRGKLEELNRLLCDSSSETTFDTIEGNFISSVNQSPVRFVITLDADTKLPPAVAKELIGTISHPLNRAWYDPEKKIITKGYGIIQPRISITPESAQKTNFSKIFSGNVGIDPYSTAVSDIYQDLNGEAVFTGKGIYDVRAFHQVVGTLFPDNRILSHDLIESNYLRAGLASDIELYDDYPSTYSGYCKRNHRWARGDWQIASWLTGKVKVKDGKTGNPINILSKWKIFDNLRRSLSPFFLILFLVSGWFWLPGRPYLWTLAALGILAFPIYVALTTDLINRPARVKWKLYLEKIRSNLKVNTLQFLTTLIILPHQSIILLDAAARTVWRLLISKKNLLEWVTASQAELTSDNSFRSNFFLLLPNVIFGFAVIIASILLNPAFLWITVPFSFLWIVSPYYIYEANKPVKDEKEEFSEPERKKLRCYARRTWFYFERHMSEEHSWLPPDNYQERPFVPVTNRTSPTNIGLGLTSVVTAYNMGYLTFGQMLNRLENTLNSLQVLEKYRGHFFNWYDTTLGEVLHPRYISTVDSGNLAAGLIVVKEALKEEWKADGFNKFIWNGLTDTVTVVKEIFQEHFQKELISEEIHSQVTFYADSLLAQIGEKCPQEVSECLVKLQSIQENAKKLSGVDLLPDRHSLGDERMENLLFWMDSPLIMIGSFKSEMEIFLSAGKKIYSGYQSVETVFQLLKENGNKSSGFRKIQKWQKQKSSVIRICEEIVQNMDFSFLYLEDRKLFSIGYHAEKAELDSGTYDLLASEARIASYIAVSKEDVPVEHWFSLGRRLTSLNENEILLSWGGTMFEYLMPALFMKSYPETLLHHTYNHVVKWQKVYALKRNLPWGQSESAYYFLNIDKHYQYRAFGAPGLGLKRGLAEDYVVAPYASFLALMVDPVKSVHNLEQIEELGGIGIFGFYDAIDFSPLRLKETDTYKVVQTYMAHHHGMSLLAIENVLNGWKIQKYFHSDRHIRGCDLLLQERVPRGIPVKEPHPIEVELEPGEQQKVQRVIEHAGIDDLDVSPPRLHLLTNGRYSTFITHAGTGSSSYKELTLTGWNPDPVADNKGLFFYIRDKETGNYWSAGHQPVKRKPDRYDTWFHNGKIVTSRVDDWIETTTEVTVSSEKNIELRRLTLTNYSEKKRHIDVTSYAEIVLNRLMDHISHPAFSKLFIQTEYLPENHAIIAKRRPRSDDEEIQWIVHAVTSHKLDDLESPLEFETERTNFIGRGSALEGPAAMESDGGLSGSAGNVSDPILSLRKTIRLNPGEKKQMTFSIGWASTREEAVQLADLYDNPKAAEREFNMSTVYSDIELEHLGITPKQAHYFQKLASYLIYHNSEYRAGKDILVKNRRLQSGLWAYGISGDMPLLVFRINQPDQLKSVRTLLKAHSFWKHKGLEAELLFLNDHPPSYSDELQESINHLIESSLEAHIFHKKGGVFAHQSEKITDEDKILILSVASVVFEYKLPPELFVSGRKKTNSFIHNSETPKYRSYEPEEVKEQEESQGEDLKFFNGYGGFSSDGKEYHIHIKRDGKNRHIELPPAPWVNVVSNKTFGFIATEKGAGYTWDVNSRENKLTSWSNDPVTDPHSEAIYIRDEVTKRFWSPAPGPVPGEGGYRVIHGHGYTTYKSESSGIKHELTQFVPVDESIKISLLTLWNQNSDSRKLSVFNYLEWVLGVERIKSVRHLIPGVSDNGECLYAVNHYNNEFAGRVAFCSISVNEKEADISFTTDRKAFIGRNRSPENPDALHNSDKLQNELLFGDDICAAHQADLVMDPGERVEVILLTGEADTKDEADLMAERYENLENVMEAYRKAVQNWSSKLSRIQVRTPDESLNVMMNGWLMYQNLACRMMARTAFYQSGGAFGFRDQLQDSMAALYVDPDITRKQLLLHAERQFPEGDVQHWWHPPTGRGVRTRITDDLLWLPYVTSFYLKSTGDESVLNEKIPFIEARQLEEDEHEVYLEPEKSDKTATLYEHCRRAIDLSLRFGEHGIPLMGGGDWNDGMNRVGEDGKGESVWLGFFLYSVLTEFRKVCITMNDRESEKRYKLQASELKKNLNKNGWDGDWYLRAYYDDGTPLGSTSNEECRIDGISQAWSVISGAASESRTKKSLDAVEHHLISSNDKIIKLLTPPFDRTEKNPGYIKGYIPGVRENGGQYTHGALWVIKAFAEAGEGNKATDYLHMINPVNHSSDREKVSRYRSEPYVVAADIYGEHPLTGRGGWTWYTGSGGWMYRVALESIAGFQLSNKKIELKPVISAEWEHYEIIFKPNPETKYIIEVDNPRQLQKGRLKVIESSVDTKVCSESLFIEIKTDGNDHRICVEIEPAGGA